MKIKQLLILCFCIAFSLSGQAQSLTSNVNGVETILTSDDAGTTGMLVTSTMGKDLALGTRSSNGYWYQRLWVKYNTGMVGIGTSNPSDLLHVNGKIRANDLLVQNTITGQRLTLLNAANWDHMDMFHDGATAFFRAGGAEYGLSFQVGTGTVAYGSQTYTDVMRLLPNGNAGIGTTNPEARLQIINTNQDGGGNTLILGPTNASNLRLGYHQNYSWIQSHGSKPLVINTLGNNVGIGTDNPTKGKLHIKGSFHVENDNAQLLHVSASQELVFIGTTAYQKWLDVGQNPSNIAHSDKYAMWVSDGIVSENYAIANVGDWDDYVFKPDYKLPSLEEISRFIKTNQHLPNFPSEAQIKQNGYNLHQMNRNFMKTIEELTLHTIEQEEKIKALQSQLAQYERLAKEVEALKALIISGQHQDK
jgi:hypothetical protein